MTSLSLENREVLNITGIKRVRTTEPNSIIADLENCLIIISGSNMSVQSLSIDNGTLDITGLINSIKYTTNHSKRFSIKNLFK